MSDREIIDKVLLILGPSVPPSDLAHRRLERAISSGLYSVRLKETIASSRFDITTVKQKKAAAKVEAAIHKLQHTLRDPNLIRRYWPDDDPEHFDPQHFDASLEAHRKRYFELPR